jgi:hypothetical protein
VSQAQGCLPLPSIIALVEQLSGGRRYRLSWPDVRQLLDDLTEGHIWLRYPMPSNCKVFRGRVNRSPVPFSNVKDFRSRKAEDVGEYGRCHQPSRSIYYAALNLDTVLAELEPDVGDFVHVAVASPKENKSVNLVAIGEIEHIRRYGVPLLGGQVTIETFGKLLEDSHKEENLARIFVDAFLSDVFIAPARGQRDYKLTSALSDIILSAENEGDPICQGFAYPSVAHKGGLNFAFEGSCFPDHMEISECMVFRIVDYLGYGIYGRVQVAKSRCVSADGSIDWE